MSGPLILAAVWVLAAAATALLPLRWQFAPGLVLLAAAPVLLWFIAVQHGIAVFLLAMLAAGSMFRKPLITLTRRSLP